MRRDIALRAIHKGNIATDVEAESFNQIISFRWALEGSGVERINGLSRNRMLGCRPVFDPRERLHISAI